MNNLSQDNENTLEMSENNENKDRNTFIAPTFNVFRLYGMVFNDIKKFYYRSTLVAKCFLKAPNGITTILYALNKVADEIATIYKNGDWIMVEGKISSSVNERNELKMYLVVYSHMLIRKNLNIESITQHEYHFKETEQLYDPFKIKERMLEKGED